MSAPAKFLFDMDFSGPGKEPAEQAVSKAALELAVAEAEARAYRNGHAAGQKEASIELERRKAASFERIGAAIAALAGGLGKIEQRVEAEAVEVAVAVASKLAGELIAREPFAEIETLAADCFGQLVGVPHVVVRVNDALYEEAHKRLEEIARVRGFDGRLVVLAEADLTAGDCRIEWADGGLSRDRAKVQAAISEAVANYLAVQGTDKP
jgi:flagellar assembly protein FliH